MRALLARYVALAAAVVVLNFLLPRLLPGDPLETLAAAGTTAGASMSAVARAELRATYHLDAPLGTQFALYVRDLAHGDLGWSISRSVPVTALVGERVPWTFGLVLASLLLAVSLGVLLGLVAASLGGRLDRLIITLAGSLAALPEFLVAMGLLLGLSVWAGWFPLHGGRASFGSNWDPIDIAWHLTLPATALVLATSASFILLTRGGVRTELGQPYIQVARSKGLPEWRVTLGHALPNALLPLLTLLGVRFGQVLGGALVIERVFGIPGLGLLAFEAIRARDYPVLQAVFLLASGGMLVTSFLAEIAYRRLDLRRGNG
jgi:peptide/nickel transport system permease protein